MESYLVGGAVRDELLGLPVKDRDWVVVGATPEQMLQQGFRQVGADFPVFLHPETREEYALARTERKQGRGYHGFTVYSAPDVTLEQDLQRRDLTINAMARSQSGELIDPFRGEQDIRRKTLRHVSAAFSEDPLRILRTARFAARFQSLGFRVCDETMSLMSAMVAEGEVDHLVPERVWQEIQRALHERSPVTFFDVLKQSGALKILIPELQDDTAFHAAMTTLDCIHEQNGTLAQRFAAVMSSLESHSCVDRAKALKAPNECHDLARLTTEFVPVLRDMGPREVTPEAILDLLDRADNWRRPERFSSLLTVLGCTLPAERQSSLTLLQAAAQQAFGVDPKALMARGIKGKALGEAIRQERLARIEHLLSREQPENHHE